MYFERKQNSICQLSITDGGFYSDGTHEEGDPNPTNSIDQRCGLGLDVSVSRRSWDTPTSRSRLFASRAKDVILPKFCKATLIKWAELAVAINNLWQC